ncbi:MAG: hypothetical protein Q8Q09_18735 [Deltaproteobacteria bacterium]|nr:hypothetical protein [Deltaproteobacteria bacterium]
MATPGDFLALEGLLLREAALGAAFFAAALGAVFLAAGLAAPAAEEVLRKGFLGRVTDNGAF